MTRYVSIPKRQTASDWWDDEPVMTGQTVLVEEESGPVNTGLYDHAGTPLYRLPDKIKPGFTR